MPCRHAGIHLLRITVSGKRGLKPPPAPFSPSAVVCLDSEKEEALKFVLNIYIDYKNIQENFNRKSSCFIE